MILTFDSLWADGNRKISEEQRISLYEFNINDPDLDLETYLRQLGIDENQYYEVLDVLEDTLKIGNFDPEGSTSHYFIKGRILPLFSEKDSLVSSVTNILIDQKEMYYADPEEQRAKISQSFRKLSTDYQFEVLFETSDDDLLRMVLEGGKDYSWEDLVEDFLAYSASRNLTDQDLKIGLSRINTAIYILGKQQKSFDLFIKNTLVNDGCAFPERGEEADSSIGQVSQEGLLRIKRKIKLLKMLYGELEKMAPQDLSEPFVDGMDKNERKVKYSVNEIKSCIEKNYGLIITESKWLSDQDLGGEFLSPESVEDRYWQYGYLVFGYVFQMSPKDGANPKANNSERNYDIKMYISRSKDNYCYLSPNRSAGVDSQNRFSENLFRKVVGLFDKRKVFSSSSNSDFDYDKGSLVYVYGEEECSYIINFCPIGKVTNPNGLRDPVYQNIYSKSPFNFNFAEGVHQLPLKIKYSPLWALESDPLRIFDLSNIPSGEYHKFEPDISVVEFTFYQSLAESTYKGCEVEGDPL